MADTVVMSVLCHRRACNMYPAFKKLSSKKYPLWPIICSFSPWIFSINLWVALRFISSSHPVFKPGWGAKRVQRGLKSSMNLRSIVGRVCCLCSSPGTTVIVFYFILFFSQAKIFLSTTLKWTYCNHIGVSFSDSFLFKRWRPAPLR